MTDEGAAMVSKFKETFGKFHYPQPIVSDVVSANQLELTNWRRGDNPPLRGWAKRNGRIVFTGEGLIRSGLISELTKTLGSPSYCSDFINHELGHYITKALQDPYESTIVELVPCDQYTTSFEGQKFFTLPCNMDDFKVSDYHVQVIIPISSMVHGWAIKAMMLMA